MADQAKAIAKTAAAHKCQIILPADRVVVKEFGRNAPHETVPSDKIPADREAVDVGAGTVAQVEKILSGCKTALWNGPLGVFEVEPFDAGTNGVAKVVAKLTQAGKIVSVAGGGDTVAALEKAGAAEKFTYVSTAGGAFLEWLEGKTLPGVAALMKMKNAA
jgi:phosphoglycerate kinase